MHVGFAVLAVAAMTALPLAFRRYYPISTWLVIAAVILLAHAAFVVPKIALGTAIYAAYSAIAHSRYRNLAIVEVAIVTVAVAAGVSDELPRFPSWLTAVFAVLLAAVAGLGIRELRGASPTPPGSFAGPTPRRGPLPSPPSPPSARGSRRNCTMSSPIMSR